MAPIGYFAVAVAARSGERRAGGEGRGAAVPADHVRLQQRHADLLHAERRAALGRRRADADGSRHRDDGAEPRAQRHPDPRAGPDPGVRHRRRGDRDGDRVRPGRASTRCGSSGAAAGSCRSRAARARSGLEHHQVAVPVRPADRHSGHRDEHRRRAHARVHRLAGAERRGAGGVRRVVHPAVLARSPGRRSA